jgi:PleD family two-component response regulator
VTLTAGVSLGVATSTSGQTDPHALLRDADTHMYEAKERSRRH